MNLQDKITTEILNKALSSMSEKDILEIAKKTMPKVFQSEMEDVLIDFIRDELDLYSILEKAGMKKKLTDMITNAIKGL